MRKLSEVIVVTFMLFAFAQAWALENGSVPPGGTKMARLKEKAEAKEASASYKAAAGLYKKLAAGSDVRREKAAYLLKEADCLFKANSTDKASEAYKKLIREYSLYLPFDRVVDNMRTLAENYIAGKGTFWGLKDKDSGISNYFFILTEAPSINVSLKDRLRLAQLLKSQQRREEAVTVYQDILKLDPTLDDIRLELANVLMELARNGDGDGAIRRAAVRQARIILDGSPKYARRDEAELIVAEANGLEAASLLELGRFYLRGSHRKPEAARMYLTDLVKRFPDSKPAWEAAGILDKLGPAEAGAK